ncbi:hypothetical protein LR48_Vigan11g034100 [Vigna angularis]|uniref:Transposase (putative) gypsy type domain-containing protein n=1 Tax=Phaseolus angularis TaxID=3914 RepID=A0A0L9VQS9_PHAAN|nr:hypothetical protein LR48_Vigan11g034100 [Vigna angularis]
MGQRAGTTVVRSTVMGLPPLVLCRRPFLRGPTGKADRNQVPVFMATRGHKWSLTLPSYRGVDVDSERSEPEGGWPVIRGYRWASHDVGLYVSDYKTKEELQWWADRSFVVRDEYDACLIRLGVSHPNEGVFHGKGSSIEDFFFVYTYLFNQLFVRAPFTSFQSARLRELNVAPSQLHPNGLAYIQAFVVVCSALGITRSMSVFLHYFHVRPLAKKGWVSLTTVQDCCLFRPYSESFKNFKKRYFKILIEEASRSEFYDEGDVPLFPFHWTRDPRKINATPVGIMTHVEVETVRMINDLP